MVNWTSTSKATSIAPFVPGCWPASVEMLLAGGYKPPRTIYLAFGADEEVSGARGAAIMTP